MHNKKALCAPALTYIFSEYGINLYCSGVQFWSFICNIYALIIKEIKCWLCAMVAPATAVLREKNKKKLGQALFPTRNVNFI